MSPSLAVLLAFAASVVGSAIRIAEPRADATFDLPTPANLYQRQCTSATAVAVTFDELVTTTFGQSVVLTGSISQLGSWNPANGISLSASQYTSSNPLWSGTVSLPPGTAFSYKYVRVNTDGSYDWEADPDQVYTVPSGCTTTATESDTWQSVSSTRASSTSKATTSVKTTISTSTKATTTSKTSSSTSAKITTSSTSVHTTSTKTTSSKKASTTATSTTSTVSSVSLASGTASASSTCTNGPSSRNCWSSGLSIDTDFDTNWPNTGKTVFYDFTITNITLSPDGAARQVFAINGQYPGPTVYANWGDTISVTVNNELQDNGTTIHWHGLRQYKANTQDGVPGVTECPIAPGNSKTYTFQATQYGTSWYHSHFSCQYGDGVLGPIVIYGPASANYDIDLGPLPITDWYYGTVNMHAARAEHADALPPEADNGLINGTMVSNSGGSYARTNLTAGKKHRLRLVNTAVDNHFMVSLDGHQFEVIAADFVPIVPYNATWIFIGIGERYDVIITANQSPGSYWFRAEVQDQAGCGTNFNNGNIKSIFSYAGFETVTPTSSTTNYTQRCTDETDLVPYWDSFVPKGTIVTPTMLQNGINQSTAADGTLTLYWNINGSALNVDWSDPTLKYVQDSDTSYPKTANVIQLPTEQQWTYWVITESVGTPFTVDVPHPIHLHGHDFYVLGAASTAWQASDADTLNYENPTRRDVAMLPSGGWLALAFQTDNPGAWIMHCHIAWHADEGFAVQFLESASTIQSVDPYPSDFTSQCNNWDSYYPSKAAYLKHDSGI